MTLLGQVYPNTRYQKSNEQSANSFRLPADIMIHLWIHISTILYWHELYLQNITVICLQISENIDLFTKSQHDKSGAGTMYISHISMCPQTSSHETFTKHNIQTKIELLFNPSLRKLAMFRTLQQIFYSQVKFCRIRNFSQLPYGRESILWY